MAEDNLVQAAQGSGSVLVEAALALIGAAYRAAGLAPFGGAS